MGFVFDILIIGFISRLIPILHFLLFFNSILIGYQKYYINFIEIWKIMKLNKMQTGLRKIVDKKFKILLIFLIIIIMLIAFTLAPNFGKLSTSQKSESRNIANWTCLFYFDGDNNLADYNEMLTNLEFLEEVGSTEDIHMVCLLDRDSADDSKVLYIKKNSHDEIPLSEINSSWDSEVNMGDAETLTNIAKWTFTNYPAEKQIILLSNHGGGWRGICWDDTSDGDKLDLADLKKSLSDITEFFGRKIDILATEACLVGMIEFVYPIQDYIDYFIGSEAFSFGAENTTEGGKIVGNWQYNLMWRELVKNPNMTPKEFCEVIVYYFQSYGPWRAPPSIPKQEASDTLSVIDTSQVNKIVENVDKFAKALKSVFPIRRERVTGALQITEQFSGQFDFLGIAYYTNIDLWDFADKVSTIIVMSDVQTTATAVKSSIDSAVLFECHGVDPTQGEHPGAHGLAIYMPQRLSEYNENYEMIDFAKNTQWDEFIKAYWLMPA